MPPVRKWPSSPTFHFHQLSNMDVSFTYICSFFLLKTKFHLAPLPEFSLVYHFMSHSPDKKQKMHLIIFTASSGHPQISSVTQSHPIFVTFLNQSTQDGGLVFVSIRGRQFEKWKVFYFAPIVEIKMYETETLLFCRYQFSGFQSYEKLSRLESDRETLPCYHWTCHLNPILRS